MVDGGQENLNKVLIRIEDTAEGNHIQVLQPFENVILKANVALLDRHHDGLWVCTEVQMPSI